MTPCKWCPPLSSVLFEGCGRVSRLTTELHVSTVQVSDFSELPSRGEVVGMTLLLQAWIFLCLGESAFHFYPVFFLETEAGCFGVAVLPQMMLLAWFVLKCEQKY